MNKITSGIACLAAFIVLGCSGTHKQNGKAATRESAGPAYHLTKTDSIERQDRVVKYPQSGQWIRPMASSKTITFYGSADRNEWEKLSEFSVDTGSPDEKWAYPDLFPLTTPDGEIKWVLLVGVDPGAPNGGSATRYFIGGFDGRTFTADPPDSPLWLDYGRDNYAAITWVEDGKRLCTGWMNNSEYANDIPDVNLRNTLTLPRELSLRHNGEHLVLASNPAESLLKLREGELSHPTQRVDRNETSIEELLPEGQGVMEITMTIVPQDAEIFGFGFTNSRGDYLNYTFDLQQNLLMIDRREAGDSSFSNNFATVIGAPLREKEEYAIRLFFDRTSVELFMDEGETVMTSLVFPREVFNRMTFFTPRGNWIAKDIKVYKMQKS